MLAVHLSDRHLSPNGFFMVCGSQAALLGQHKNASPLEHVAKHTVMQACVNLSVRKIQEDLVYENTCMTVFAPSFLDQERNQPFYKKHKHDKKSKNTTVPVQDVVKLLKFFAQGE